MTDMNQCCMECEAPLGEMHVGKCNPDNREGYAWLVIFEDMFLEFDPIEAAEDSW